MENNQRQNLHDILKTAPPNKNIQYALTKSYEILSRYHNVEASISGGSDSDIMLDILLRTGNIHEIRFSCTVCTCISMYAQLFTATKAKSKFIIS